MGERCSGSLDLPHRGTMYRDPGFEQCAHHNLLFPESVNGGLTGPERAALPVDPLRQQTAKLGVGQVAPLPRLEAAELHVADPRPQQRLHAMAEMRRHKPVLSFQLLHKPDSVAERAELAGLSMHGLLSVERL